MITVIIAGGSGTRLWPLSTPNKPKHLLSFNGKQSLLQDAYERAKLSSSEVYVVTDTSHAHLVKEQLRELDQNHILVEPGRKGTASCIILALAAISASKSNDPEIAFFHADHHITDRKAFANTVKKAAKASRKHLSIALIGIEPEYPATGFGYIKKGQKLNGVYRVDTFKEKPDLKTAKEYVASGDYLWNLGLFAAPLSVFEQSLSSFAPNLASAFEELLEAVGDETKLAKRYKGMKEQAIDTALIEKASNLIMVPGDFDWMDIGSYKDLHEVMPASDKDGNVFQGSVKCIDTSNSIVISHHRPVAVIGLDNIAVIETEDGLLVCHKDCAQQVKDAAKHFNGRASKAGSKK